MAQTAVGMGKAVDEVRKKEHRAFKQVGDETLTGSKYLWLYAQENLPGKHEERFSVLKKMKLNQYNKQMTGDMLLQVVHYQMMEMSLEIMILLLFILIIG